MKKTRKTISKTVFLIYSINIILLLFAGNVFANMQQLKGEQTFVTEELIRSLIDPFISQMKVLPEVIPEPVIDIKPILAEPLPPVEEPTPVIVAEPVVIEAPQIVLTGIMFNPQRPMVIIDGEVLEQGNSFNYKDSLVTIIKINKNRVDYSYKNQIFNISTDPKLEK